jgi:hypothetical protein
MFETYYEAYDIDIPVWDYFGYHFWKTYFLIVHRPVRKIAVKAYIIVSKVFYRRTPFSKSGWLGRKAKERK